MYPKLLSMEQQIALFAEPAADVSPATITMARFEESVEVKSQQAITAILNIFKRGQAVSVSFSGGKDSSVLMHLTIQAALQAKELGLSPYVAVLSSDTGVENPEVSMLLRREHTKISRTLQAAGIAHEVLLTQPSLATSWAVRILGGTKLPSFPGNSHDCSVDYKVAPIASARKGLFKKLGAHNVVTLIGTRFDESERRGAAMRARGELADTPYRNEAGELVMSPVAFWSTDDIWEAIGLVRAGITPSYSDFEDTFKLYADAGGTSCAVISDMITESTKKARGGCGARFGCYTCQAVGNDTSLQTMIESDPQYAYMDGLSRFREFISRTHWDYSKRQWVQRSIDKAGYVTLQPDCYSPAHLLELFRFAVTLDAQETREARKLGIARRFQIVTQEAMVAIDALWSLNGFHAPHTAFFEWNAIHSGRKAYPLPRVEDMPFTARGPVPAPRKLYVGSTWDGEGYETLSGLHTAFGALSECHDTKGTRDGRTMPELETEARMEVDLESLAMALDFEEEGFRQRHKESRETSDWTSGYRFWVSYGTLSLSAMQTNDHDIQLRRTAWRARNGLHGEAGNQLVQTMAVEEIVPRKAVQLELA